MQVPLQWSTATRSSEPLRYEWISLAARGRTASGGTLRPFSRDGSTQIYLRHSLVIWKRIPAHATLKNRRRVRVFCHGTKVEHPVVLSVACVQKPLCVFALVSVQAFHTGRRVAHDDHPIRNVHEIFGVIESGEV